MSTIIACATPWAKSGIAVLRLSGPDAKSIVQEMCSLKENWKPRRAQFRKLFSENRLVDEVLTVWMPKPRSFTGEEVVEISCHGNPVIVELIIDLCVELGARPACPPSMPPPPP